MNSSFLGFSSAVPILFPIARARGKLLAAFTVGVACLALTTAVHAYPDDCPADFTSTAGSGEFLFGSSDGKYASRPTCPFFLIDVAGTAGKELTFEALWGPAGELPANQGECESATVSWTVSQFLGGIEYSVVGRGSSKGRWVARGSGGVCLYQTTSGPAELFISNAPGSSYRLLLAAGLAGVPVAVSASVTIER